MSRVLTSLAALLLFVSPASAVDCGRLPTGKNPTPAELSAEIARASATHNVPTEIIKAIAWRESGCQQWRADGSLVYNKKDCGLGMFQLTGATAKQFDLDKLKDDWKYNLDSGVRVMVQKWKRAERKGQVPTEPEARRVLENWYYPVAYYWGGKTESYLKKVFDHLEKRPGRLQQLLAKGVKITLASEAIPGFKWGDAFRALPDNVFVDAKGNKHKAPTHKGTIGDPRTIAMLDVCLTRGRKALVKGKTKQGLKYLRKVFDADLDTQHKLEAKALIKPLEEATRKLIKECETVERAAGLKLLKRVQRDWKGYPIADEAKAAYEALKKK